MAKLYDKYRELFNYLIVGVLTTVVSLSVYYGLVFTVLDAHNGFQLQVANVISWICAVTFAYIASRLFVFRSNSPNILKEAGRFYSSRVVTLVLDMLIMFGMVTVGGFNDRLAKLVCQVVVTILNYVLSKLLVFKK